MIAVRFLSAFLLLVAAYLAWWAIAYGGVVWGLGAVVSLATSVGLFTGRSWGRLLWYLVALTVGSAWIASIGRHALTGWPYSDLPRTLISLLPGLLLLVICGGGSLAVARQFRGAKNAP
jgi:hypothetical protein